MVHLEYALGETSWVPWNLAFEAQFTIETAVQCTEGRELVLSPS